MLLKSANLVIHLLGLLRSSVLNIQRLNGSSLHIIVLHELLRNL